MDCLDKLLQHSTLWRAYGEIRAFPEGYNHLRVNHLVHFVDPVTKECTNHVENMWKNTKISHKRHKARCGTQRSLLSSYLQEFMWRLRFGKNSFRNIIEHIILRYPLHINEKRFRLRSLIMLTHFDWLIH